MRVIAGKYKRLLLKAPKGLNTRPSLDQVKEATFSIIGDKIIGASCLDLFSGSGSLGIEAFSRGAAFVHFNDISDESISVIKENLEHVKVTEPYVITRMDFRRLLKKIDTKFDIIFLDPPFKDEVIDEVVGLMEEHSLLNEGALFACETDRVSPKITHDNYTVREYRYGRVCLTILRRNLSV